MRSCPKCKKQISKVATKCRYCYADVSPRFDSNTVLITSAGGFDNFEIIEEHGFVFGEYTCPNGILGALTNGTFSTVSAMADARAKALAEMENKALRVGANAIVGLDLDISDLNGNGVLVSANGTAVYVIPANHEKTDRETAEARKAFDEKQTREQEEQNAKQIREQKVMGTYSLSSLEYKVLSSIQSNTRMNAVGIRACIPINIPDTDIMNALKGLVDRGFLSKDAENYYSIIKKIDLDNPDESESDMVNLYKD